MCVGKWGDQLDWGHLVGKHWGVSRGQHALLPAAYTHCLPGFRSNRVRKGQENRRCTGAKPGDGVFEVWLGRIRGKRKRKAIR